MHAQVQFGSLAIVASTRSPLPWKNKMASTIAPWTSLTLTLTLTNAADPKSPTLPYLILPLFPPDCTAIKLFHQINLQNQNFDAPAWFPEEKELDMLPGNITGVPPKFHYYPFCYIDWKEEAQIHNEAALWSSIWTMTARRCFYMFRYMRASTSNYTQPNKATDRVVYSWDGYSSLLLVVDEAMQYIWVFLTKSKDPPLDIVDAFLKKFAHDYGKSICTDQGGKLARAFALSDLLLRKYGYVMEPIGTVSPSQNVAVEVYNGKVAIKMRTLFLRIRPPRKILVVHPLTQSIPP
jgi:hypothetical protein